MPETKSKNNKQKTKTPFAKKSFGQNFLVDENYINKIISALDPQPNENIVEIGAGRGALTEKLIESGANVAAIELEREMISVLRERFGQNDNFQLIESDALKVNFDELINPKSEIQNPKLAKLVANLPYYISTAILQRLIEQRAIFSEMILMFQREVVERITAPVGNSERGFLTVLTEAYLEAEKLFDVPPNAFRPAPKVWSAVVRLKPKENADVFEENADLFRKIVSAAFRQKRKTIINNLKNLQIAEENWSRILEIAGIDSSRRAESLNLDEWRELLRASVKQCSKL
ncbi:MAG TPA: 16S rRNA (adenine(1518)-N(6)/adenine(1519)-N(6))-dimethyltransferase RsmA [Pyrinomonadaceae bacterium]|jgi:16S rRNA (adenine1518-N6/adenine1519-N6)-dimethyltransferase